MEHIVTTAEVVKLGRPIGKVDETKLLAYITESEQMCIKPALGEELFANLLLEGENNDDYKILLNGGAYRDANGDPHTFLGLKVTLAYFVNAQNIMSGDFQSTRYGMVLKDGDYSAHISSKERSDCYNNTLEVANHYLNECVRFCKAKNLISQKHNKRAIAAGGILIRKIGN